MTICLDKQIAKMQLDQYRLKQYLKQLETQFSIDEIDSYNIYIENYGMLDTRIAKQFKKLILKKYGRDVYFPFPKLGDPEQTYETKNGKCTFWTESIDKIVGAPRPFANFVETLDIDNPMVITYMKMDKWSSNIVPIPVCIAAKKPFMTDDGDIIFHRKKYRSYLSNYNWSNNISFYLSNIPNFGYSFGNNHYEQENIIKSGFSDKYLQNINVIKALNVPTSKLRYTPDATGYAEALEVGLDFYLPDLVKYMEQDKNMALKDFNKTLKFEAKEIGISLEEYVEQLSLPAKLAKQSLNELKEAHEASKEMKYLPELLLSIASLKDEIETTYNHFNNENSKMSFRNIESRLSRIKDMQRVLQSIRKEDKIKK